MILPLAFPPKFGAGMYVTAFILYLCRMRMITLFLLVLSFAQVGAQTPLQLKAWRGDSVAMMDLSQSYSLGDGVLANEDSAKKYLDLSASKGYPGAQYLKGSRMMSQIQDVKKYDAGVALVREAADAGLEAAQVKLSALHKSKGTFTPADKYYDLKKSYSYGEMAALNGNIPSLRNCAEARLSGAGTIKNDSIGIAFMLKAAVEKKDPTATVRIGDFYLEGKMSGKPDPFTALTWYRKAHALPNLNMDQRNAAELGMFKVDTYIRRVHNAMIAAGGTVPAGAFEYLIRKE